MTDTPRTETSELADGYQLYETTRLIKTTPMYWGDWWYSRYPKIPAHVTKVHDPGYKVEFDDSPEDWIPKVEFEERYTQVSDGQSMSDRLREQAAEIEALKSQLSPDGSKDERHKRLLEIAKNMGLNPRAVYWDTDAAESSYDDPDELVMDYGGEGITTVDAGIVLPGVLFGYSTYDDHGYTEEAKLFATRADAEASLDQYWAKKEGE